MRRSVRFAFASSLIIIGVLVGSSGGVTSAFSRMTPRAAPPEDASLALPSSAARADFALRFYQSLARRPGNVFASPYSLTEALAMVGAGASGSSAKAFDAVLGRLVAGPRTPANPDGGSLVFKVANALWAAGDFHLQRDYVSLIAAFFGANVQRLDFATAPDQAASIINRWASDHTEGKVNAVVSGGDLPSDTAAVITDAVWFKGVWGNPFDSEATYKDDFYGREGEIRVDMMHQTDNFALYHGHDFKLLLMPFRGGHEPIDMVLILPDARDGLGALEQAIDAPKLARWVDATTNQKVELALPKFTGTDRLSLASVVSAMGLGPAFSPGKADFSGIAPLLPRRLYLSDILQKSFVDLNERGTEAAAVTAIMMRATSARYFEPPPDPPVRFLANHPFLYLIRDEKTGDILFIGRMANPAAMGDARG